MRKGYCLTSEETSDHFVGVRFRDGNPEVVFPHGYHIPDDEEERRRDVFRLLGVLRRFSVPREGERFKSNAEQILTLPIQSYLFLIQDFLERGYYIEEETFYIPATSGKISWKRTIQLEKPQISGLSPVYLKFQVKKQKMDDTRLITCIHKYCVFKSVQLFGWLLPNHLQLPKPDISVDKELFLSVLQRALFSTFNDYKRNLFQNMITIIKDNPEKLDYQSAALGVYHFSSVWERLVDYVFGEEEMEDYFPKGWFTKEMEEFSTGGRLEPDTIMKYDGKIYVLDSSYYRYGRTKEIDDFQMQIAYGKQIVKMEVQSGMSEEDAGKNIYNAFVMPFCASPEEDYLSLKFVAVAKEGRKNTDNSKQHKASASDLKKETENYKYILGIQIDTRHLITTFSRHNRKDIKHLANMIEESLVKYKPELYTNI